MSRTPRELVELRVPSGASCFLPSHYCFLFCAPLPRLPIHQTQPLKDPLLRLPPIRTPRLLVPPSLQINPPPAPSLPHAARIEFPSLDLLRVASQVTLERGAGRPSGYGAANRAPRRDDDVDAAMGVRVLGGRVRDQIVHARGPVRVLPHDQGFIQAVEAVPGWAVERA